MFVQLHYLSLLSLQHTERVSMKATSSVEVIAWSLIFSARGWWKSQVWFPCVVLLWYWAVCCSFFLCLSPGRPLPHQPAPDAHELLPVRHGHHYVLLCSHQGTARQSPTEQPRLLSWEGTTHTWAVMMVSDGFSADTWTCGNESHVNV